MTPSLDRAIVAKGGFKEFVKRAWPHYDRASTYSHNWHIEVIADELERTFYAATRTFAFNVPPGHSKSSLMSLYQVFAWIEDPGHRFLFGSYPGSELGKREAGKMIALVADPWFRARWDHFTFVDRKNKQESDPAVKLLFTSKGGFRLATTPGGGSTGEHVDTQIFDDMHKAADLGKKALKEVADFVGNTTATRWRGSRSTRISGSQRMCSGDVTDVLLEQGADHLVFPLEYDPAIASHHDRRTVPGELLDPTRYSPEAVAKLKAMLKTASARSAQLQQFPLGAGGKIWGSKDWFKSCATLPERFDVVVDSWDLTFKGEDEAEDPDFVAGQRWGRLGPDVFLIRRALTARRNFPESVDAILEFRAVDPRYPPNLTLIEDKANGPAVISTLRRRIPGLIAVNPIASKTERASLASEFCKAGNVYLVEHEWDFLASLAVAFPKLANDDDIDALTQAINYLLGGPVDFSQLLNDDTNGEDLERLARLLGIG